MRNNHCERCPGLRPHRAVEEILFTIGDEPQAIRLCIQHRDEFLKMLRPWRRCARTLAEPASRPLIDQVASRELTARLRELKERADEKATPVIVRRDSAMPGIQLHAWRMSVHAHSRTTERGFDPLAVLAVAADPGERFLGHDGAWCRTRGNVLTVVDEDKLLVVTVYDRFEYQVEAESKKKAAQSKEMEYAGS